MSEIDDIYIYRKKSEKNRPSPFNSRLRPDNRTDSRAQSSRWRDSLDTQRCIEYSLQSIAVQVCIEYPKRASIQTREHFSRARGKIKNHGSLEIALVNERFSQLCRVHVPYSKRTQRTNVEYRQLYTIEPVRGLLFTIRTLASVCVYIHYASRPFFYTSLCTGHARVLYIYFTFSRTCVFFVDARKIPPRVKLRMSI